MKGVAVDLSSLLGNAAQQAEMERRSKLTMEERRAEAKEAFRRLITGVMQGCKDESHRPAEEAMTAFIRHTFAVDVLPEPVADAVLKVMVGHALHNEDLPDALKRLVDSEGMTMAMTVAGAVLYAIEEANKQGVAVSTGNYL